MAASDHLSPQQFPVRDLMNAYSTEYDSPVHGVAGDLDQEKVERYSRMNTTPPPVHLALPVPGEEPEPVLLDGHHRVIAASRSGKQTLPVVTHKPVRDADGDVDYPSFYSRR